MKNIFFMFILYCSIATATIVNGRIVVVNQTSAQLSVKVQINTDSGTDDMGGVTIPISYDSNVLSIPSILVNDVQYTYHNFSGGNYSPATVTRNIVGGVYQVWLNIDLPLDTTNIDTGTVVAQSPNWTDVVTLNFDILNTNASATLTWLTNSMFWGIYDGNNTIFWNTGVFDNLEYPLPVELTLFTVKVINKNVKLEWQTETEINNHGFDIERKVGNENWIKIGFEQGYGNSNSPKYYTFTDNKVIGGNKFKYRLKQIDNDGTFEYSNEIEIHMIPTTFIIYQNYPNPFNPSTTIKYEVAIATKVEIKIFNISGIEILTLFNEYKDIGIYETVFNASELPSGVYFYRVYFVGHFSQTKKMILVK